MATETDRDVVEIDMALVEELLAARPRRST